MSFLHDEIDNAAKALSLEEHVILRLKAAVDVYIHDGDHDVALGVINALALLRDNTLTSKVFDQRIALSKEMEHTL